MTEYGYDPTEVRALHPDWDEYMHYLYLPVVMPSHRDIRLPERLDFLEEAVELAMTLEQKLYDYAYVTARRGYATPGNPLNRPGWHADGFGTDDVNYIWSDRWPTRFAVGDFGTISEDHIKSAEQFEERITLWAPGRLTVYGGEPNMLYRLDSSVIHATPEITAPGGDRSFFKISLSNSLYNLVGNSHNYLFDYNWRMWARDEVRNDPAWAGGDSGPQE